MTTPAQEQRYSHLAPFTIIQKINLSLEILGFFSSNSYEEKCEIIGKPATPGAIYSFHGKDFFTYLERTGTLPEPDRYMHRISELISTLERSGLLISSGVGLNHVTGNYYTVLKEFSTLEGKGILWLSNALGADFIYHIYSKAIVQITGKNKAGDAHAGSGIIINKDWILTCRHVINDMTIDEEQSFGDQTYRVLKSLPHPTIDVGLIQLDSSLPIMPSLAFRDPNLAESLFTLGYPRVPFSQAPHLIMQRGEVTTTDVKLLDKSHVFLYSAIARPGNSGGPIISSSGHIVGIVSQELTEQTEKPNTPFYAGISASTICDAIHDLDPTISLPFENWE